MKRLIIVASLAILAVGCQKTFVENEVLTPIGFSTEVGKQTRTISQTEYSGGPFGVFSYGYQSSNDSDPSTPMEDVEMVETSGVYAAAEGTYYWPNSAGTTLNFYAYSPYDFVDLNHAEGNAADAGFTFANYVHEDTALDFMIADPVTDATFSDKDGDGEEDELTSVPMVFRHKMTQVVFKVQTNDDYEGITFTVNSITLNDIRTKASFSQYATEPWYAHAIVDVNANDQIPAGSYNIFSGEETVDNTDANTLTTIGVTMIPQVLGAVADDQTTPEVNEALPCQSFTIKYTISGAGVATETVTKPVDFTAATLGEWKPNMLVTYTLKLGLDNQITFTASVGGWDKSNPDPIEIL